MADTHNADGERGEPQRRGWLARLGRRILAALAPAAAGGQEAERGTAGDTGLAIGGVSAVDLAKVVPDPIIVFDRSGSVVHANEAALAAFGPTRRFYGGTPFESLVFLKHPVVYDTTETTKHLARNGLRCPEFHEYVPVMVDFFRTHKDEPAFKPK